MDLIADLDRALGETGEDIIIRRVVGTINAINLDVTVRASVRPVPRLNSSSDQLDGGVSVDDIKIVISLTQIQAAQWPGGGVDAAAPFNVDRSIPRRGDKAIVKGKLYHIDIASPIMVQNEVIRVTMLAKGGASSV